MKTLMELTWRTEWLLTTFGRLALPLLMAHSLAMKAATMCCAESSDEPSGMLHLASCVVFLTLHRPKPDPGLQLPLNTVQPAMY